jgi:hypothetical protein
MGHVRCLFRSVWYRRMNRAWTSCASVHHPLPDGRVVLAAVRRTVSPPHPARTYGGFPPGVEHDLLGADWNGGRPQRFGKAHVDLRVLEFFRHAEEATEVSSHDC